TYPATPRPRYALDGPAWPGSRPPGLSADKPGTPLPASSRSGPADAVGNVAGSLVGMAGAGRSTCSRGLARRQYYSGCPVAAALHRNPQTCPGILVSP